VRKSKQSIGTQIEPIWTYCTSHWKKGNTCWMSLFYNRSRKYRPCEITFVKMKIHKRSSKFFLDLE